MRDSKLNGAPSQAVLPGDTAQFAACPTNEQWIKHEVGQRGEEGQFQ